MSKNSKTLFLGGGGGGGGSWAKSRYRCANLSTILDPSIYQENTKIGVIAIKCQKGAQTSGSELVG